MRPFLTLLLTGLLFQLSTCYAQIIKTKLDIVGGISAPEFVHAGLRYQYADYAQAGIYYGGDMGLDKSIVTTYSADNMLQFGKENYHSGRPVWYARQGLTFTKSITTDKIIHTSKINLALGREFPVNDWLGFNADLGATWQVREKYNLKGSDVNYYDSTWIWMALFRVQVFISL